jgi:CspA family cold shock protein
MPEQGTIKWFKRTKGYGFITPAKGGPDVLLHINLCHQLNFAPRDNMKVAYEAAQTPTGSKAVWVGEVR